MQLETKKYLHDIKIAIDSIYDYIGNAKDFNQYKSNKQLRRAVERELEIIGEATNRSIKIDTSIDISNSRRIVNLRNLVIHAYDNVDDIIIWGILHKDIPLLKTQIEFLLTK